MGCSHDRDHPTRSQSSLKSTAAHMRFGLLSIPHVRSIESQSSSWFRWWLVRGLGVPSDSEQLEVSRAAEKRRDYSSLLTHSRTHPSKSASEPCPTGVTQSSSGGSSGSAIQ